MSQFSFPIILIALAFSFISCESAFEEEPANNNKAIFDNLWNTFNEEYAPFEERNVNWGKAYTDFSDRITVSSSDEELYSILTEMLALLDDGHVTLTAPGKEIFNSNYIRQNKIGDELFDLQVIKGSYIEIVNAGEDDEYIFGTVKGHNIGYIWFDYVGDNFFKLEDFLNHYENAEGLIIDLRHNQGGDFTYAFSEMGRLTDEKRYVFRSKTKNGKGKDEYTEWHSWYIEPSGKYIDLPVCLLTDRYTISAGERAVMAFMTLPNVTSFGDTTSGAHGTMIGRELANGWYYSLVPQKVELPDGNSYEGKGLAPDVVIINTRSQLDAGTDAVMEAAITSITAQPQLLSGRFP